MKIQLGAVGQHSEAGMSNHDLFLLHEFGSSDGKVPARAPLRKAFNDNGVLKLMAKTMEHAVEKHFNESTGLDLPVIGDAIANSLQQNVKGVILRGLEPPLSPDYLEKKTADGFSSIPLVRTKELVNSLTGEAKI